MCACVRTRASRCARSRHTRLGPASDFINNWPKIKCWKSLKGLKNLVMEFSVIIYHKSFKKRSADHSRDSRASVNAGVDTPDERTFWMVRFIRIIINSYAEVCFFFYPTSFFFPPGIFFIQVSMFEILKNCIFIKYIIQLRQEKENRTFFKVTINNILLSIIRNT